MANLILSDVSIRSGRDSDKLVYQLSNKDLEAFGEQLQQHDFNWEDFDEWLWDRLGYSKDKIEEEWLYFSFNYSVSSPFWWFGG